MPIPLKRTKILATIGPATASYETILKLIQEGANGVRFNYSHGNHDERVEQIKWVREASREHNRPVAVLQDLQGPKIRLGDLNNNRHEVRRGDEIILQYGAEHHDNILPVQYNLAKKVKTGESVYIFDGKVRTTVTAVNEAENAITLHVENEGTLMSRKGINLPDTDFSGDILTEKDLADIEMGATLDIDYVSLSFVQSAVDIEELRQILLSHGSQARVIAKIETKAAIEPATLEQIVRASDGIMVARGDLAVEAGAEVVPVVQQTITRLCRRYGKLSIIATQMMASMVDHPEPTRAEVSDVANAVMQGADTVMLSDETANGSYPVEAVAAMRKTIMYTQENSLVRSVEGEYIEQQAERSMAIAHAAISIADRLAIKAIVAETKSGATAENISACRPLHPILAVTPDLRVAQQLALTFATRPFVRQDAENIGLTLVSELLHEDFFGKNAPSVDVVHVSGQQPGVSGGTDTIMIRRVT